MSPELSLKATAYTMPQLIQTNAPQIGVVGRSNVGKSSLINALSTQKNIAKVSSTPGKTRSINYFLVTTYDFYIVDLPGYGYARASHAEREKWNKIIEKYLTNNSELVALMLLLDCRLEPQGLDKGMANYAMEKNIPIIPVLTKIDKCTQQQRRKTEQDWSSILGISPIMVSSHTKTGIQELWKVLLESVENFCG